MSIIAREFLNELEKQKLRPSSPFNSAFLHFKKKYKEIVGYFKKKYGVSVAFYPSNLFRGVSLSYVEIRLVKQVGISLQDLKKIKGFFAFLPHVTTKLIITKKVKGSCLEVFHASFRQFPLLRFYLNKLLITEPVLGFKDIEEKLNYVAEKMYGLKMKRGGVN